MYHQAYLDTLDSNEYDEFLFWSGQISKKGLDPAPKSDIMDNMKDIEIEGDLRDEYLAIQEAEKAYENTSHSAEAQYEEEQEITGMEVSELLIEMWEEDRKREASMQEDLEYTEEDVFRDFISDQYEEFN
jgi:hypothetical protein